MNNLDNLTCIVPTYTNCAIYDHPISVCAQSKT